MFYSEKLKEIRENANIKQTDLAKYLKISNKTYSAYEIQYEIIPSKHLISIVDYLNVSIDYLFGFTDIIRYDNYIKGIDKKIAGERLKEWRKEHKLTQSKLAKELNRRSRHGIKEIETGNTRFYYETILEICKKHNIKIIFEKDN